MTKKINGLLLHLLVVISLLMAFAAFQTVDADAATTAVPKVSNSKITYYSDDVNNSRYVYITVTLPSSNSKLYYRTECTDVYKTSGTSKVSPGYRCPKVKKISKSGKKVKLRIDMKGTIEDSPNYIYLKLSPKGKVKKVTIYNSTGWENGVRMFPGESKSFIKEELADKVIWTSSDEEIISINENQLPTGVNPGTATLTATVGKNCFQKDVKVCDIAAEMKLLGDEIISEGQASSDGRFYFISRYNNYSNGNLQISYLNSIRYYPKEEKIEFSASKTSQYIHSYLSGNTSLQTITVTAKMDRKYDDPVPVEYTYTDLFTINGNSTPEVASGKTYIENPSEKKNWYSKVSGVPAGSLIFADLSSDYEKLANDLYDNARYYWSTIFGSISATTINDVGLYGIVM